MHILSLKFFWKFKWNSTLAKLSSILKKKKEKHIELNFENIEYYTELDFVKIEFKKQIHFAK